MLYVTTENKANSYTAHKVLRCAAAPDGGMFMPMSVPVQDDASLAAFAQMNTGESFASILNLFFGTKLSGWDVDFAVGRQTLESVSAGYKVFLAESWHNTAGTHDNLVKRLHQLVTRTDHVSVMPNLWFYTVVDIAILFAVYGKFCRQELYSVDIAVETGNLQHLLAIRYAQKMGLPIRKIILGCLAEDSIWEFVAYGTYPTSRKHRNPCLEALLWLEFGYGEAQKYSAAVENRTVYHLEAPSLEQFRNGIFATVVGDDRVKNVVESTMRTDNYQMERSTARAFAALQDYRAKKGFNNNTLLFSRNAPVN